MAFSQHNQQEILRFGLRTKQHRLQDKYNHDDIELKMLEGSETLE